MTISCAQRFSKITALKHRAQNRGREQKDTESNQSWKSNLNPEWSARERERTRFRNGRGKRASKNERRRRAGGRRGGTEERLAGCSRRSNFQNGSSSIKQVLLSLLQWASSTNPSQNVRRMPPWVCRKIVLSPLFLFQSPPTSCGPENRSTDHPRESRTIELDPLSHGAPVRLGDTSFQNKKFGTRS